MKSLLQFSEAPLQNVKVLDVEQVLQDPKWYGGGAKADQRTHIFESTACIVAMEGKSLTLSGLQSVMNDSEFDSIAKENTLIINASQIAANINRINFIFIIRSQLKILLLYSKLYSN